RIPFRWRAADAGDRTRADVAAEAYAPRRTVAWPRTDAGAGDLRDRTSARGRGEAVGAASRAERGGCADGCRAWLRHGKRAHCAPGVGGIIARQFGYSRILSRPQRGRRAQIVPRHQALQAPQALAVLMRTAAARRESVGRIALTEFGSQIGYAIIAKRNANRG